jgi:hypothetical protein
VQEQTEQGKSLRGRAVKGKTWRMSTSSLFWRNPTKKIINYLKALISSGIKHNSSIMFSSLSFPPSLSLPPHPLGIHLRKVPW